METPLATVLKVTKALELKVSIQPKAKIDGWRQDC